MKAVQILGIEGLLDSAAYLLVWGDRAKRDLATVAGHRASVIAVEDSLYVVPIGVEDERGVVPGVIVRAQPGSSVVDPSCLDGCGVERIDRFAVWRGKRNVHRTGRGAPFPDPEVLIAEREARPQRAFDDPDAEGLQRPFVEHPTPCDVAYRQRHMIEQAL